MKTIKLLLALPLLLLANQSFSQQIVGVQGDITMFFYEGGESIDNLNCQTFMNGQFDIIVQNSVLNDTVKIIYNGFSQQDVVINTTGSSTFIVSQSWINNYLLSSFSVANGNPFYYFSTSINKIIANGDTLMVYNGASAQASDPGCTYSQVDGDFFIDNNFDCQYNTGDNAVMGTIYGSANYANGQRTYYENSNSIGHFQDQFFKSDGFIDATFSIPSIYNFAYTIPSCSQISYNITSLPATINFARECAADIDLRTYVDGVWPGARPLIPFNLYPNVSNIGCQPVSGILELALDPNVTYDPLTSSNPADSIYGNSLFWHYTNLTNVGTSNTGYWNQFFGGVSLTPNANVNIGDNLTFTVQTQIPANDAIPANNSYQITIPVVNSYDPNVKNVVPKGYGSEGFIPATTAKLTYTVHFQNTGNADAINIFILDTLEGNVIPRTLKIIDASHIMVPSWLSNNVLRFDFQNIHLPDSTTNERDSHGFVSFEIDMVQGLPVGTTLENTAYIYFDANPAIITNTALNTIGDFASVNDLNSSVAGLEVLVYPNPMTESTTFIVQNDQVKDFTLELYDMTGQLVIQKHNDNSSKLTINKNSLQSGIYMYKIIDHSTNNTSNGKLVIQ